MNATAQLVLVAVLVAFAGAYAALKLMPGSWRRTLAAAASGMVTRWGFSELQARRVEAKLSSGGACGSCDSCKACAKPAVTEAAPVDGFRQIPIRRVG